MKTKLLATGLPLMLFFSVNAQYISSTTDQISAPYLNQGSLNNPIIRIRIDMGASGGVLNSLMFDHNGSSNPTADIQAAKVYCTGSSTIFSASVQYGSAWMNFPVAAFNFSTPLSLAPGTNYLWLTYDIKTIAICNNYADAGCNSITVNSATQTPTVTTPPGAPVICGATGINEQASQTGISISPNPASDKIYISFPAASEKIPIAIGTKIFSVTGENLFQSSETLEKMNTAIDVTGLSNGIYFVNVKTGRDKVTKKIVVNH